MTGPVSERVYVSASTPPIGVLLRRLPPIPPPASVGTRRGRQRLSASTTASMRTGIRAGTSSPHLPSQLPTASVSRFRSTTLSAIATKAGRPSQTTAIRSSPSRTQTSDEALASRPAIPSTPIRTAAARAAVLPHNVLSSRPPQLPTSRSEAAPSPASTARSASASRPTARSSAGSAAAANSSCAPASRRKTAEEP